MTSKIEKMIPSQRVVDLTMDVGGWKSPLHLRNEDATQAKILAANDKFFDIWEDCLFLMIVNTEHYIVLHALVNEHSDVTRTHAQYGWVLAYFQDCMVED